MANELEVRTRSGRQISLQLVQDVYNDLTGKTESSSRLFFDAHIASLDDLENLHHMISQAVEQYDCTVMNFSMNVRLCDGKSENFSDYSKFKMLGTNRNRATTEIALEYDFLILLPKTSEAKPYKLVVRLRSGIGVIDGFKHTNATETEQTMYFQLHSGTGRFDIHYVDLAVARSLEAVVEDWYRGLSKAPSNKFLAVVRSNGRWIPSVVRSCIVGSVLGLSYYMSPDTINSSSELFRAILISAVTCGVALSFSVPVAAEARKLIDRSKPPSALLISKADTTLYEMQKNNPLKALLKATLSSFAVVALGLITTYIGIRLGIN
jgi:hypothetical protein